MKNLLVWLLATLVGGVIGYFFSWLTGMSIYLCVGCGVVLGSSLGVTMNIHRVEYAAHLESDLTYNTSNKGTQTPKEEVMNSVDTSQKEH